MNIFYQSFRVLELRASAENFQATGALFNNYKSFEQLRDFHKILQNFELLEVVESLQLYLIYSEAFKLFEIPIVIGHLKSQV